MKNRDQFYQIVKDRRDFKGERYFRFNPLTNSVVQICINQGEDKKGRAHVFGVYTIHRLTFLSNYFNMGYCEQIPRAEFNNQFKKIVNQLK